MTKIAERRLAPLLAATLLACGGAAEAPVEAPPEAGQTAQPPNVVLIVVDTLRRDHLGCYGYERATSPHIDRLAREGVRYANALSQAPWTTPSLGALFTSQYPSTLGIENDRSAVPDEFVLLPEALASHGYTNAAVISHTFCSAKWRFDQGFQHFDESNVLGHDGVSSQGVSDDALDFLASHAGGPFFLWLHYFDPHFAYKGHAEHDFRDASYAGAVRDGMPFSELTQLRESLGAVDVAQIVDLYDSEIAHTDGQIGRVLDDLRQRGLFEDSLVILTADHGEEFLDHGRLGHAKTLYQELVHVPLLVKFPRATPGVVEGPTPGVVERRVALIDVYPTVLEVLGLESAVPLEGRSLPRSEDPDAAPRSLFCETSRGKRQRAIVRGRYKLVERIRRGEFDVFDLAVDPLEQVPLDPGQVAQLADLRAELEAWATDVAARASAGAEVELSEEELSELEALGYGGDD